MNSGNLGQFSSPCDPYNHFAAEKVGGACSHLGAIGPKVIGALAHLALWLQRPCEQTHNKTFQYVNDWVKSARLIRPEVIHYQRFAITIILVHSS